MTREEFERRWAKIRLNSELPLVGNTEFRFYDPNLAASITETGQRILREMLDDLGAVERPKLLAPPREP